MKASNNLILDLSCILFAVCLLFLPFFATQAQTPGFFAHNYGGKCLDFGPPPNVTGSPVFIFGCNGTIAQQIRIVEVNDRHDVILRAGNKVIGVKFTPVIGPVENTGPSPLSSVEIPLELQVPQDLNTSASLGQIFALDGDSLMLASNHKLVVKVQNARGTDRTPLVLGERNLADSEFWTLTAADGSGRRPTGGFVRVTGDAEKFANDVQAAKPGTVFEIERDLDLTDRYITIPPGVTIRGDRRFTRMGAELFTDRVIPGRPMFEIMGGGVRITGLRLRGPTRSTDSDAVDARGVLFNQDRLLFHGSIIDHNDLSDWTLAAVDVRGLDIGTRCQAGDNNAGSIEENVRVTRNFIHHNRRQGEGYGVVTKDGANTLIDGNTFLSNRHAIAAGGEARTIYRARYNLVLSPAPVQKKGWVIRWNTHDFDMHGTANKWWYPAGFGGTGGQYVQIERNTFLGRNRNNFKLRGEPCYRAEFLYNVALLPRWDAVECRLCGDESKLISNASLNWYQAPNPTARLGVGDFDGDGTDDLFMTTGAAWYYAPQGVAEWRFLNTHTDLVDSLRFGDFDGDRRTDVFTQHGGRDWVVSWGGASKWEKINESSQPFGEYRMGDFVGDGRADVFYADGQNWYVSDGGSGPFVLTATSGYKAHDLGFGDFNGDGKTDVAGVVAGQWMVSLSASRPWTDFPLRPRLTKTMAGLIVADFNGNGIADIATAYGKKVSYDGRGDWKKLPSRPGIFAAVGRFDPAPGADLVFYWTNRDYLGIQSSATGAAQRHSSQDMR